MSSSPEIFRGSVGEPGVKCFDDISHVPFVVPRTCSPQLASVGELLGSTWPTTGEL